MYQEEIGEIGDVTLLFVILVLFGCIGVGGLVLWWAGDLSGAVQTADEGLQAGDEARPAGRAAGISLFPGRPGELVRVVFICVQSLCCRHYTRSRALGQASSAVTICVRRAPDFFSYWPIDSRCFLAIAAVWVFG